MSLYYYLYYYLDGVELSPLVLMMVDYSWHQFMFCRAASGSLRIIYRHTEDLTGRSGQ